MRLLLISGDHALAVKDMAFNAMYASALAQNFFTVSVSAA